MIQVKIKKPDGEIGWAANCKTQAEADSWIEQETQRGSWGQGFVVETEQIEDPEDEIKDKKQIKKLKESQAKQILSKENVSLKELAGVVKSLIDDRDEQ